MSGFAAYSSSFDLGCDPTALDIGRQGPEYLILAGEGPLRTPGGHLFSHPHETLIRLILSDLQLESTLQGNHLSSSVLFSFRQDHFDTGVDPIDNQWETLITSDPFVRIKSSGIPVTRSFSIDDPLFNFSILTLTGLTGVVNDFTGKAIGELGLEEVETLMFAQILRLCYDRLPVELRVATQAVSHAHHSWIVLPLLFVMGEISAVDYAKGLISLKIKPKGTYHELLTDLSKVQAYINAVTQKPGSGMDILSLIREGESDLLEFKTTLRWDMHAQKTNPALEHASLKTISAFLNTKGGILLIGVHDDGTIEGIESDRFANEDKFLLHLWNLIRHCLGRDVSSLIRTRTIRVSEKAICMVECSPSQRPVFVRQPGFNEEMFIRVGPSSNALDISEALKYIEDRYPRGRG